MPAAHDEVISNLPLAADFAPATSADWRKLVDDVLKGTPFEKLVGKTYDGLRIEPIYTRVKGARAIGGRVRGGTMADDATDRSSRFRTGQRAGVARS